MTRRQKVHIIELVERGKKINSSFSFHSHKMEAVTSWNSSNPMKKLSYAFSSYSQSSLFSVTTSTVLLFLSISSVAAVRLIEEASTFKCLARLDEADDAFKFNALGTIFMLFGSLFLELLLYKARDLRYVGGSWLCSPE